MTTPEFSKQFQDLIERAVESGIPIHQIIMTVEMAKIELGFMHCVAVHQQRSHAMAKQMANDTPKIIQPNN